MLQDPNGLLWFGGNGGISCFDGHAFSTFRPNTAAAPMGSPPVLALIEDGDGSFLVGFEGGGLSRFDSVRLAFEACRDLPGFGGELVKPLSWVRLRAA